MADIKSPEERSRNMSAIRSRNTKPELYLRKLLFAEGLRYRTNVKKLPGCPEVRSAVGSFFRPVSIRWMFLASA